MKLNTTTIPTPHQFVISNSPIEKITRLASGKLVKDVVAIKKTFSLSYNDITGTDLNTILGIIGTGDFVTLEYPTETGTGTATVTAGEIPRELWINSGAKRYREVSLELVEQ